MSWESLEVAASFSVSWFSAPELEPDDSSPFLSALSVLDSEPPWLIPGIPEGGAADPALLSAEKASSGQVESRPAKPSATIVLFMMMLPARGMYWFDGGSLVKVQRG